MSYLQAVGQLWPVLCVLVAVAFAIGYAAGRKRRRR